MKARYYLIFLGFFLGIGVAYYCGYHAMLYYTMKEMNDNSLESACLANRQIGFEGTITNIERYSYDGYMEGRFFAVEILIEDSLISFQYNLPEDKTLLDYLKVGQEVLKYRASDKFQIIDNEDNIREFYISKCGR